VLVQFVLYQRFPYSFFHGRDWNNQRREKTFIMQYFVDLEEKEISVSAIEVEEE
jgi:hypothetical protein